MQKVVNRNNLTKAILLAVVTGLSFGALATPYSLDAAHAEVGFKVKHLMISDVKGRFNKFEGAFEFDEKKSEIKNIDVKITMASVDTNDKKRDEHLAGDDFFSAAKFPMMTFKSDKAIAVKTGKSVKVAGTLTIRDVTKPVTLDVEYRGAMTDPWGNEKIGFSATTKINRKDFGVKWNKDLDKGGVAVGDEVTIMIDGEAGKVIAKTDKK